MLYEFCAENFERVPAAIEAGARRIELCDNLAVGGTTPSAGVISATVSYAHEHDARVMCMIRPRGGDFHYNQDELRMMEMDLGLAVSAGVDGLVFGCCKPCAGGWALDDLTLGALVMAAGCATEECKREPIDITFHMAFDQLSPEAQLDAIDTLADCGVASYRVCGRPLDHPSRRRHHYGKSRRGRGGARRLRAPWHQDRAAGGIARGAGI